MKTHPSLFPGVGRCRLGLLWLPLALPLPLRAQFDYVADNNQITITGYDRSVADGRVVIPDTIDGLPVTAIGASVFSYRAGLTSVTIGNNVTTVGQSAFSGCTGLTQVAFPDSLTSVEFGAFSDCTGLERINLPKSLKDIGYGAFYGCRALRSVTIPNSVTFIGPLAFSHCGLTVATIGIGVTRIGDNAFAWCFNLREAYFLGNAPSVPTDITRGIFVNERGFGAWYPGYDPTTVYHLPGTTGWGESFSGRPTASWSSPLISAGSSGFGGDADGFGFLITWAPNATVVVEASVSLSQPDWTPVSTNTLTAGSATFADPHATNRSSRFYRLRTP